MSEVTMFPLPQGLKEHDTAICFSYGAFLKWEPSLYITEGRFGYMKGRK